MKDERRFHLSSFIIFIIHHCLSVVPDQLLRWLDVDREPVVDLSRSAIHVS
jgi:hypothetical protein